MIPIYTGDEASNWLATKARSSLPKQDESKQENLTLSVKEIIAAVRTGGDQAIRSLACQFGDKPKERFRISDGAIDKACKQLPADSRQLLDSAAARIRTFAVAVMNLVKPVIVDCGEFQTGMDFNAVSRAACYVPGGRFPLPSTALMTAMTALVAGVKEIIIFTPSVCDEIIYAGTLCGVSEFYEIGGAQAIAAAAFGTESINPADMIVGPGNCYVTEAKRQVQGIVGIDMLAGPSEICVIADNAANSNWIALDLLSQAEHDPDARAYLLTDSIAVAENVRTRIRQKVDELDLPEFIEQSLGNSAILVLPSTDECIAAANAIAPEHLQLQLENPEFIKPALTNYGALFMGTYATVPYGDYLAGPNHTLPTGSSARFCGALTPLTFLRPQSWIKVDSKAPILSKQTTDFATLEGLIAHAAASNARVS